MLIKNKTVMNMQQTLYYNCNHLLKGPWTLILSHKSLIFYCITKV